MAILNPLVRGASLCVVRGDNILQAVESRV